MGGPDGYLSPVQFLDHLTVIITGMTATATGLLSIILVFRAIATATGIGLLPIILVFRAGLRPV